MVHIPGENGIADALSRNDMSVFSSLLPQAAPFPSAISQSLLEPVADLGGGQGGPGPPKISLSFKK